MATNETAARKDGRLSHSHVSSIEAAGHPLLLSLSEMTELERLREIRRKRAAGYRQAHELTPGEIAQLDAGPGLEYEPFGVLDVRRDGDFVEVTHVCRARVDVARVPADRMFRVLQPATEQSRESAREMYAAAVERTRAARAELAELRELVAA